MRHLYIFIALLAAFGLSACEENKPAADALPAAAGEIVADKPNPVPAGETVTLEIAAIEGAETYRWYKDGVETGAASESRTLAVTKEGIYRVAGVNEAGEGRASADYVVVFAPATQSLPAAAETIVADKPNPVPAGETVTLEIAVIEGAETYRWYKDGVETGAASRSRTLSVTEEGIYRVAGVNEAGEGRASADYVVVFAPATPSLPAAAGTIVADKPNPVPAGQRVTLEIAAIEGAETYRWYKDGVETGAASESRMLVVTKAGTYRVAGVNEVGEGAKSAGYEVVFTAAPPDKFVDELVGEWDVVQWKAYSGQWLRDEHTMTVSKDDDTTVTITGLVEESMLGTAPVSISDIRVDNNARTIAIPPHARTSWADELGTTAHVIAVRSDGTGDDWDAPFPAQSFTTEDGKLTCVMHTYGLKMWGEGPVSDGPVTTPVATFALVTGVSWGYDRTFFLYANTVLTKRELAE